MITVLDIAKFMEGRKIRVELLADSKSEKLPAKASDIDGLSGEEIIDAGSTCITPDGDMCIMGNNGQWGGWI